MAKVQQCSTDGCDRLAAFTTRTKPAWCLECLIGILSELGLDPLETFPGPKNRWLTRCRSCAAECHYRLEYLLDLRTRNEPSCRRCFWNDWAEMANRSLSSIAPVSVEQLRQSLAGNGFDPVEELRDLPSANHPVLTRCRQCGRQEAQRLGDLGWGCTCTRNTPSSSPAAGRPRGGRSKNLLVDSDSPALKWWNRDANSDSELQVVTLRARREANWLCPDCGHRFSAKVYEMTDRPTCPKCEAERSAKRRAENEVFKRTPVSDVPELRQAWADEADPSEIMVSGGWQLYRFRCENGHYPKVRPSTYLRSGCQFCQVASIDPAQRPTVRAALPEIAEQWHPDKNGKYTPDNVGPDSKRTIWWRSDCCKQEWPEPVRDRNKYKRQRCPECRAILDSLAWTDPGLAAEWSTENPVTAWHLRPTAQTDFVPKWVCSVNPEHRWDAPLASRSAGSECPECRESGKSRVELDHLDAAKHVFAKVRSGAIVRGTSFITRKSWTVDILVEHGGAKIAVEYDGAYWHAPEAKILVDQRKSLDLLAAGYMVVRLRENDLPSLDIEDDRYLELRVHSAAPRPTQTIGEVARWVEDGIAARLNRKTAASESDGLRVS